MSIWVILGIWVAVSALIAPVVGYFLAGRPAPRPPVEPDYRLQPGAKPRA